MFLNKIVQPSLLKKILTPTNLRPYTVIVERCEPTPLLKNGMDPRRYPLKSKHFRYKFVECQHTQKWGNVDLILTDYVEGVGHKGEIISAPRHLAYYSLLPSRLAVYPTEEYLEMYKEDRVAAALKPKVSPYALKTQEELNKMVLNIQMNMDSDWTLNRDHIRLALRYNKVMCPSENITIPADLEINKNNLNSYGDYFVVNIKINDYLNAYLKCKIVPVDTNKLWEKFAVFNKTI